MIRYAIAFLAVLTIVPALPAFLPVKAPSATELLEEIEVLQYQVRAGMER